MYGVDHAAAVFVDEGGSASDVTSPALVERHSVRMRIVGRRYLLHTCPRTDLGEISLSEGHRVCVT